MYERLREALSFLPSGIRELIISHVVVGSLTETTPHNTFSFEELAAYCLGGTCESYA